MPLPTPGPVGPAGHWHGHRDGFRTWLRPRPTVPATARTLYGGPSESVGRGGRPGGILEDHNARGPSHGRLTSSSRLAAGPQLRAELSLTGRLDASHRMNRPRLARTTNKVAAAMLHSGWPARAEPGSARSRGMALRLPGPRQVLYVLPVNPTGAY